MSAVLVIDTSSPAVTAAVVDVTADDVVTLAERVHVDARAHGELLAPAISECLREAGRSPRDLAAVVAGLGPGPFTGLRVGLVTAAVLSDTLGIPSYGVCSLDAIAAECADAAGSADSADGAELLVVTDARRREVYWARYSAGQRSGEPAVDRPAEVPTAGVTSVAGAGADLFDFGVPRTPVLYPPPRHLAALAGGRIQSSAPGEVLVPLYLRRPDAVANPVVKAVTP